MKILPTERAMGFVTIFSGLAIPIGLFFFGAGPMGDTSQKAVVFEKVMWVVNPFGLWSYPLGAGLYTMIGLYILGTMISAFLWGMIDALLFRRK